MLKISSALRENITMAKPKSLQMLSEKICMVYEIKVFQLLLIYENDEEESLLLENDKDYSAILDSNRDYAITTYIKPLSKLPKFVGMSVVSLFFTYALMKFSTIKSMSVSINNNSELLFVLFLDIIEITGILVNALVQSSFWIPICASLAYVLFLTQYWFRSFFRNKAISKWKISLLIYFYLNFLPNIFGYITSMVSIVWFVLVCFHILLHRPKPRSSKDKTFLKVLSFMIITAVARIIYFY